MVCGEGGRVICKALLTAMVFFFPFVVYMCFVFVGIINGGVFYYRWVLL
jgi:hypothetical protein